MHPWWPGLGLELPAPGKSVFGVSKGVGGVWQIASYLDFCNQKIIDAASMPRLGAARAAARQEEIPVLFCTPVLPDRLLAPAARSPRMPLPAAYKPSSKRRRWCMANCLLCIRV